MIVWVLIMISSLHSFTKPIYITDYTGNYRRSLIRYGLNVPNNGIAYRFLHKRRDEISIEEKMEWIANNRELYDNIMAEMDSRGKYADIRVRW